MNTAVEHYFETKPYEAVFLDHTNAFREKRIPVEIRTDRFTGRISRILKYRQRRFTEPSHDYEFIEQSKTYCPFCPGNLDQSTPRFPHEITPEGHIRFGGAIVLPNAFPYSQYCGLSITAFHHYLSLNDFSNEILFDCLKASLIFIQSVRQNDAGVKYASINWNYMMASGGGQVHPHFQVVANQHPTRFHHRLIRKSAHHRKFQQRNYWCDLIEFEKKHQIRYIYSYDHIEFISVFSPAGMFGEVLAVFTHMSSLSDITDNTLTAFATGLSRMLRCFHRMNLDHLNMTFLLNLEADGDFWIQSRVIPRRILTPHGTSDVNFFEKGHDEIIVTVSPEDLAEEIRNTVEDPCRR